MGEMSDYYRDQDGSGYDFDFENEQRLDQDRRESEYWQTLDGRQIPYRQLEERHLLNILRTCRAGVVKASETTINALGKEVLRRGLEPLPDYESYEEAMAVSAVSSLYLWWRRVPPERLKYLIAVFDAYLSGADVAQFMLDDPDRVDAEKRCIKALEGHDKFLQLCSPAAKMRTNDVFRRWAIAMDIDEALSL